MKLALKIVASLIFVTLLFLIQTSIAQPLREQDNAYKIELDINRSGQIIASPKFTLASGHPAQVTITSKNTKDGNFRIQATATPAGALRGGEKLVKVKLMVLEQIAGAWVVVGEPSLVLKDGKPADLSVSGPIGALELKAKATSEFNTRAVNFSPSTCPSLTAPLISSPAQSMRANDDCCSAGCGDGSGSNMQCCGAVECCACGSCCSPPQKP